MSCTLWFCACGNHHCVLLFAHIILCLQNILPGYILNSDMQYAKLCLPCAIALLKYKTFNSSGNRNIKIIKTFQTISHCYSLALLCSVVASIQCIRFINFLIVSSFIKWFIQSYLLAHPDFTPPHSSYFQVFSLHHEVFNFQICLCLLFHYSHHCCHMSLLQLSGTFMTKLSKMSQLFSPYLDACMPPSTCNNSQTERFLLNFITENLCTWRNINTWQFWLKSEKNNGLIKILAKIRQQQWTLYVNIYTHFCVHTTYFTKYLS